MTPYRSSSPPRTLQSLKSCSRCQQGSQIKFWFSPSNWTLVWLQCFVFGGGVNVMCRCACSGTKTTLLCLRKCLIFLYISYTAEAAGRHRKRTRMHTHTLPGCQCFCWWLRKTQKRHQQRAALCVLFCFFSIFFEIILTKSGIDRLNPCCNPGYQVRL